MSINALETLLAEGRLKEAEAIVSKAIKAKPEDFDLHEILCGIRFKQENLEGALNAATKLYKIRPTSSKGYVWASKVFRKRNMIEAAFKVCKLGLKKVPNSDSGYQKLVNQIEQLGKLLLGQLSKSPTVATNKENREILETPPPQACSKLPATEISLGVQLPLEIVYTILMMLPLKDRGRCMRVSHAFKSFIGSTRSMWSTLDLSATPNLINDKTVITLLGRGGNHVTTLRLNNCNKVSSSILKHLYKQQCPLVEFSMINVRLDGTQLGKTLSDVASKFLQQVVLRNSGLTDNGLFSLLANCSKLKCLDFSNCENITDAPFQLLMARSELKSVDLEVVACSNTRVSANFLSFIGGKALKLRGLNMTKCQSYNLQHLSRLSGCSSLECLRLGSNFQTTWVEMDSSLLAIGAGCPNLREFYATTMPSLRDSGIETLSGLCADLVAVDLSESAHITDDGLVVLARRCKSLGKVVLQKCQRISDTGVSYLIENASRLDILDISDLQAISDKSIKAMAMFGFRLRHLFISGSSANVTNESLLNLAATKAKTPHHLKLATLAINRCPHIVGITIEQIKGLLPNITIHSRLD